MSGNRIESNETANASCKAEQQVLAALHADSYNRLQTDNKDNREALKTDSASVKNLTNGSPQAIVKDAKVDQAGDRDAISKDKKNADSDAAIVQAQKQFLEHCGSSVSPALRHDIEKDNALKTKTAANSAQDIPYEQRYARHDANLINAEKHGTPEQLRHAKAAVLADRHVDMRREGPFIHDNEASMRSDKKLMAQFGTVSLIDHEKQ